MPEKAEPRKNAADKREDGMPVGTPFQKGNGGRPKGSRNALGEAFLEAMHEDFQEHGKSVIATVRAEKPDQYLKVIASILPKDLNVNVNNLNDLSDDELRSRIRDLETVIRPFLTGEAMAGTEVGGGGVSRASVGTGSQAAH
jgi:hypothetical protein